GSINKNRPSLGAGSCFSQAVGEGWSRWVRARHAPSWVLASGAHPRRAPRHQRSYREKVVRRDSEVSDAYFLKCPFATRSNEPGRLPLACSWSAIVTRSGPSGGFARFLGDRTWLWEVWVPRRPSGRCSRYSPLRRAPLSTPLSPATLPSRGRCSI